MSSPRSEKQLVRIAVLGIAVLVLGFTVAINFQRLPMVGGGTEYRAEFSDASGLVPGEEVRVAGIKVGQVTDITLGRARAVVTFRIKGVDLPDATTAGIEVKTLLGQHFLSLDPAGSGKMPAGAVIPLARTSTPINIVPAFQRLTTQQQEIDTEQVAAAFDALSETLTRTAPEMTETLRGLSRISRSVSQRDEEIRELFARTSFVSGVVAERDADIAALITDTDTVLAELDRRRATITRIIAGTTALARQLSGLVADNHEQLEPALNQLNGVLAVLRKNRTNLDEILKVGAVYGREFANVGGSGRWFDASIKAPRAISLCSTGGLPGGVATLLDSVLSQINQNVNGSEKPCLPLGPAVQEVP